MVVNGGMVAVRPRWSSRFWVTNAGMIHMYEKDRKKKKGEGRAFRFHPD